MEQFWENFLFPIFSNFTVFDAIDIALVAFIVYHAIRFVRETRAGQLLKGILILLVLMYLSEWLKLNVISFLLANTMQVGLIALVVVFQPELRRVLEKMGRSNLGKILPLDELGRTHESVSAVDEVAAAAEILSKDKTGALIVIERKTRLGDILTSGTVLNANVTTELLMNIFVPNTPLHDGAVVIRDNIIVAAACVLPLTANENLSRELGTRHRAALGMSEASDAAVVVVSEETGKISLAVNGSMRRNLTRETLKKALDKLLDEQEMYKVKKHLKLWKGKQTNE